jgi:hypothetical protein
MAPTNGDGGTGNTTAAKNQYQLLGYIQPNFTANPPQVQPFGTTTLSWNAQIPTTLRVPVTILFSGQPVKLVDSRSVTVPATSEFFLSAKTELASRVIGTLTVQVDTTGCLKPASIPASVITQTVESMVRQFIPLGSGVSEHGNGIKASMDVASLSIDVPLTISQNEHSGTLDVNVAFFVGMSLSHIPNTVEVAPTNVHVSLDLQGFGANTIYQEFGQDLSTVFVRVIAGLVGKIMSDQLTAQVQSVCDAAHNNDGPNFRTFELTELIWDDTEFKFTVCPKGSGAGTFPTEGRRLPKSKIVSVKARKKQKPRKVRVEA